MAVNGLAGAAPHPFASVIVPCYNDEARLAQCLRALERQDYPQDRFEVVVVDNRSEGDLDRVVREYAHARMLSENGKRSSYAARNTGIAGARGDVLAFTDADCIPNPDWLRRGVARFLDDPACGVVGGAVELFAADPERPTLAELYECVFAFPQRQYVELQQFAATANMMTTKHVMTVTGVFDSDLASGGDHEWGKRAAAKGFGMVYAADAVVRHPARSTAEALLRKQERVMRGLCEARRRSKELARAYRLYLATWWLPPWRHGLLPVMRSGTVPPARMAPLLLLVLRLHYYRYGQLWGGWLRAEG